MGILAYINGKEVSLNTFLDQIPDFRYRTKMMNQLKRKLRAIRRWDDDLPEVIDNGKIIVNGQDGKTITIECQKMEGQLRLDKIY